MKTTDIAGQPCSEYILGAAQLGMAYGVTNTTGMPGAREVAEILQAARQGGVSAIDTARAYGSSEAALGTALRGNPDLTGRFLVMTKTDPLDDAGPLDDAAARGRLRDGVLSSGATLGVSHLPVLLLHRSQQLFARRGLYRECLLELVRDGTVGALGVSVYDPDEALRCLEVEAVRFLQLPFNVLDTRHWRAGVLGRCRDRGVRVFARSVLLQGLLGARQSAVRGWPGGLREPLERYHARAEASGMTGRQLAVAFCRAFDELTGLVIGAESADQVRANAALFDGPALGRREAEELAEEFAGLPEESISPAHWNRRAV